MKKLLLPMALLILTACNQEERRQVASCDGRAQIDREICFFELAVKLSDTGLCNNIRTPGERVNCKSTIALNSCDTAHCESITVEWKKPGCREKIENAAICKKEDSEL